MNEQCSFIDSVSRVIVRKNVMETKVKKCDPIDQQEGSVRQRGTQDKNPPCSDRQDCSVKVKALEKFDPNGSNNEQETSEGIQAEESLCLESLVRKDSNMQALNLDTHHVSKQQAGVEKPGNISTKKQQCSDTKAIIKTDHTQISHDQETFDVQLETAYAKPSKYRTIQSVLKHLQIKRHTVKGDGSCLYHAIAHQAGLIASSSTGDEVMSNHLRQLTLLAMLNYQLECSLSDQDWQAKQLQVLTTCEWGGDIELRLMVVGLKRDIMVVTDSNLGNLFACKFPHQLPPVPKMTGGVFIPVTSDELCSSDQSTQLLCTMAVTIMTQLNVFCNNIFIFVHV